MPTLTRFRRTQFFGPRGTNYNLFSMKNKPTENIFKRLFQSIGFITEADDTATTTTQGFSQLATDAQAAARNSTVGVNGFAKTVQPHHLPNLIAGIGVIVTETLTADDRTGGQGNKYIVHNKMEVTSASDIITVTQTGPGENVELDIDSAELNTAIEASQAYQDLTTIVEEAQATAQTGLIGEIKMYGLMETLGSANCEFDADGIGRAANIDGATGQWSGWVLLLGQAAASLTGADTAIVDRITLGGNIPDTKKKYVAGIDSGDSDYDTPFKPVGENTHQLTEAEMPNHDHSVGTLAVSTEGDHDHGYQTVLPEASPYANGTETLIERMGNDVAGERRVLTDGDHTHDITGSVYGAGSDQAHENRPLSFIVCYAMYVGTTGSTN